MQGVCARKGSDRDEGIAERVKWEQGFYSGWESRGRLTCEVGYSRGEGTVGRVQRKGSRGYQAKRTSESAKEGVDRYDFTGESRDRRM